jgi:GNAT superfamily N-acetyltransferase
MNQTAIAVYSHEQDIVLRDGASLHVRPTRPSDRKALETFMLGLSEQSRYFRFFSLCMNSERVAEGSIGYDPERRYALVATAGDEGLIVAHAIYIETSPGRAEVAFAVSDVFQERGIGTILLHQLADVAVGAGITSFEAFVLPENRHMVSVFRGSGFPVTIVRERGDLAVDIQLTALAATHAAPVAPTAA